MACIDKGTIVDERPFLLFENIQEANNGNDNNINNDDDED